MKAKTPIDRAAGSMGALRSLTALCLAAWLTGCATAPPDAFYTLTPIPAGHQGDVLAAGESPAVGVGPISLPEYLDRTEIVGRNDGGSLNVDEVHLWGGSLVDDFPRVLGENLGRLLGTSRILLNTTEVRYPVDIRVAAVVLGFEVGPRAEAELKVRWMLIDPSSDRVLSVREGLYRAPVRGEGPAARVEALSRALGDFSREVAEAVRISFPLPATGTGGGGV
jgi:uncharacterized lipoprotein YmbA